MRNMRLIMIIVLASIQPLSAGKLFSLEEAKKNGMWETLQNYITSNSTIADICIYEQEWIPLSKEFWKGRLVRRAVVTHVHCGTIKLGDRIEYVHFFEEDPGIYRKGTSTVPGDLRTFFCDPDESEKPIDGILKICGDGHWGFCRVGDVFAELFALERKTNPKLTPKSEQTTTDK